MDKQDLIVLARQAGIDEWWESGNEHREELQEVLERFAKLVIDEAAKQREWVGLRPDEIGLLWDKYSHTQGALGFARAIEAKLKEKNT